MLPFLLSFRDLLIFNCSLIQMEFDCFFAFLAFLCSLLSACFCDFSSPSELNVVVLFSNINMLVFLMFDSAFTPLLDWVCDICFFFCVFGCVNVG